MWTRYRPPNHNETHDYWISYSDLMAGLLLAFILMLVGTLVVSKRDLEQREERLEQAREELKQLNGDLDKVLGVRAALIERLRTKFKANGSKVTFDDATGAIRLGSNILFDEGSSKLTSGGKSALDQFLPVYFEALLGDPKLRPYVGQIVFEGHTNSNFSGSRNQDKAYLFNLRLSQARAYAAMEHVVESEVVGRYRAKELLAANGYSSSRLMYKANSKIEDKEKSRRIEIRFRLKDDEALEKLNALLSQARKQK